MAVYLVPFLTALRTKVRAAWPDVTANGIYHVSEFMRLGYENKVQAGGLPVAVYEMDLQPSDEWGADNAIEMGPVTIYRIVDDAESFEQTIQKLEDLRNGLYAFDPSVGQVLRYPAVTFSADLPLNQYFLSTQRPFRCGAVIAEIQLLEPPS